MCVVHLCLVSDGHTLGAFAIYLTILYASPPPPAESLGPPGGVPHRHLDTVSLCQCCGGPASDGRGKSAKQKSAPAAGKGKDAKGKGKATRAESSSSSALPGALLGLKFDTSAHGGGGGCLPTYVYGASVCVWSRQQAAIPTHLKRRRRGT